MSNEIDMIAKDVSESVSKRLKIENLIHEELERPKSHSSHFEPSAVEANRFMKRPHEKRITDVLSENLKEQVTQMSSSSTSSSSPISSYALQDGDLPFLNQQKQCCFVEGISIGWPFPVVLVPQRQIMLHMIHALKRSKHVVLESPTGTGKSAALLCTVLAWQRYHRKQQLQKQPESKTEQQQQKKQKQEQHQELPDFNSNEFESHHSQIIYCSRTHSQVAQMVESLRKTPYRPRMAILASRQHLCLRTNSNTKSQLRHGDEDSHSLMDVNRDCRIRVRNTEAFRKTSYLSKSQYYDDNHPPQNIPEDELQTTTNISHDIKNEEASNEEESQRTKPCCPHYRQLTTKDTSQLACRSFIPCHKKMDGGVQSKFGTHDLEDLLQFGRDPYRVRDVAVYRATQDGPFGMTLIEQGGAHGEVPRRTRGIIGVGAIRETTTCAALNIGDEILTVNGTPIASTVDEAARQIRMTPRGKPLILDVTSHPDHVVRNAPETTVSDHAPCPYYLSRALAKGADIVFCPYNYVLDPTIRKSVGISLHNTVVIMDEAHNIEDVLRDSGSGTYSEFELAEIIVMLHYYSFPNFGRTKDSEDDTMPIADCAHSLLVFIEALVCFLLHQKDNWEQYRTPILNFSTLQEDHEFEMTLDGPNGYGVRGKAVGCATFFTKLGTAPWDGKLMYHCCETLDNQIRCKPEWQLDRFGVTLDKLAHLIHTLTLATEHSEHFFIASVVRPNNIPQESRDRIRWTKTPQKRPILMSPGRHAMVRTTKVCHHAFCRKIQSESSFVDGNIGHGWYCDGSQPTWEACLILELLTPAPAFLELRQQCRTVVLASGSLAPIPSLCAELGLSGEDSAQASSSPEALQSSEHVVEANIDAFLSHQKRMQGNRLQIKPKPLEANHVIDLEKQLLTISCGFFTDGTPLTVNYANWSKPSFFDKLGDAIATVVEAIPSGGVLVFLPSYSFLQKCVHAWKPPKTEGWVHRLTPRGSSTWERLLASKGSVIIEPTGSQRLFEIARDTYDRAIREKGRCILLAVFRGKMSEGISFNDDYARCVICVGLPYPNAFNRSIKAKRLYNDEQRKVHGRRDLLSGNEWYAQQAYRAIAQALGRCIRHASDYGTIILMDSRQCDHGVPREGELCQAHSKLPKWMRHSVKNMSRQHSFGDPFDQVIPGGWSGLKNKIQQFFVEAPSHVHSQQSVIKQQTNQSDVSSKSNENILQPTSNEGQSCGTDISTANEEFMEGTITRIVTPPTPMIYDWIYS